VNVTGWCVPWTTRVQLESEATSRQLTSREQILNIISRI
jgi:hypothetical protein